MIYTVTALYGKRLGSGTYDEIFDSEKYPTIEKARKKNEIVVMDFVLDEAGVIYIQSYHFKRPAFKVRHKLIYQQFVPVLGVDKEDDQLATEMAIRLFNENIEAKIISL